MMTKWLKMLQLWAKEFVLYRLLLKDGYSALDIALFPQGLWLEPLEMLSQFNGNKQS